MVDALDSKSGVSNGVRVRVSSPVNFLYNNSLYIEGLFFLCREKWSSKLYTITPSQDISLPFAFLLVFALVSL